MDKNFQVGDIVEFEYYVKNVNKKLYQYQVKDILFSYSIPVKLLGEKMVILKILKDRYFLVSLECRKTKASFIIPQFILKRYESLSSHRLTKIFM